MRRKDLPRAIRLALIGVPSRLVRETLAAWEKADAATRADILAFFESDGPKKVHDAKLKIEDGVPTSADLARDFEASP